MKVTLLTMVAPLTKRTRVLEHSSDPVVTPRPPTGLGSAVCSEGELMRAHVGLGAWIPDTGTENTSRFTPPQAAKPRV